MTATEAIADVVVVGLGAVGSSTVDAAAGAGLSVVGSPVLSTLTCLYSVPADGDFVIDRHPQHPQVVIASPCSGHGSKYTTAIGPLLVDLATTGSTRLPIAPFSIDRFSVRTGRS